MTDGPITGAVIPVPLAKQITMEEQAVLELELVDLINGAASLAAEIRRNEAVNDPWRPAFPGTLENARANLAVIALVINPRLVNPWHDLESES